MNKDEFSLRIKTLRKEKGMKQKDFAKAIGISCATLSAYENSTGGKKPSLDTLVKIAETFHVSLDWLCGLTDSETPRGQIKTCGDAIRLFFQIDDATPIGICDNLRNPQISFCIGFLPTEFNEFFKEWMRIKEFYENETIDKDIYFLWREKTLKKYDLIPASGGGWRCLPTEKEDGHE